MRQYRFDEMERNPRWSVFACMEIVAQRKLTTKYDQLIGIDIFPPTDPITGVPSKEALGKSSVAGQHAISQTAASRVLTNMFVFV